MSSTAPSRRVRAFVVIAVVVSFVAVVAGIYELHRARSARSQLERVAVRDQKAKARLQLLLQADVAAETNPAGPPPAPGSAAAEPDRPPSGPARERPKFSRADWERFVALNPSVSRMLAEIHRAQLSQQYRAFFEQAKLTPDQIEEFMSRSIALFDQTEVLSPTGGYHPTAQQLPDDQLQSILGGDGLTAFKTYVQTMPAVGVTNDAAAATASAGSPLSPDQQARLTEILLQNNDGYVSDQHKINFTEDFAAASAMAQQMMTPTQWQAARSSLVSIQYRLALMQAQRSANAAGK